MSERSVSKNNSKNDRSSMYKHKSRGIGDRLVRGIRFQVERKQSRTDEFDKRRRMPLSPIETENQNSQEIKKKQKDAVADDNKKKTFVDKRREKLFKWKEEKLICKMADELEKSKRKPNFVVKHVTYPTGLLPKINNTNKTPSVEKTVAENGPRTSTRLADKTAKKLSKDVETQCEKESVENKRRTVRSTTSKVNKPVATPVTCKKTNTTRSRSKTDPKIPPPEETSQAKGQDKPITEEFTKQNRELPEVANILQFIPNNIVFTAPVGVNSFSDLGSSFTFKPLSPYTADKFMFPSRSSVFDDTSVTMAMLKDKKLVKNQESVEKLSQETDSLGKKQDHVEDKKKDKHSEDVLEECLSKGLDDGTRDASAGCLYFRGLVETETKRLLDLCCLWEQENNGVNPAPEEVEGLIRTAIGQVQLLVTKKFKQFRGLIDISEDPNAEQKTLISDLQGFWEMVYIQVEDIDRKFKELEELKMNNWVEEKKEVKKATKKTKKATRKPSKTGGKTAETRNKFRELRAQMKAKLQEEDCSHEAFKMVLTPVKNKKQHIAQGEAEVVLTPLRRSTRNSISSQPRVVSTPKGGEDFKLRLTPTTDEEPSWAGKDIAKESEDLNFKNGNKEIEQEPAAKKQNPEGSDILTATASSSQTVKIVPVCDTPCSTGGDSPMRLSTTEVPKTEIDSNACATSSVDENGEERKGEVKSSRRKRRLSKSTRVGFTCSPPYRHTVTPNKRSCRRTPSHCRMPTPFSDGARNKTNDDDNALLTGDVTDTPSESERTGDEQKKFRERMPSIDWMTEIQSASDDEKFETPRRNLAAEVDGNESFDFNNLYLQHSFPSSNQQVDPDKISNASFHTTFSLSESKFVTPTPSKLTKTPMPDAAFTPTLKGTITDVTSHDVGLIDDSIFVSRGKTGSRSSDLILFSPTPP